MHIVSALLQQCVRATWYMARIFCVDKRGKGGALIERS